MGLVQELFDLTFGRLKFYEIVEQFQQGLHFRNGLVIKRRIRWNGKELERIIKEEGEETAKHKKIKFYIPFYKTKLPDGWGRKFFSGLPKHPKRYDKDEDLQGGIYLFFPIFEYIVKRDVQRKPVDLGKISMRLSDKSEVTFGAFVDYSILSLYKAAVVVQDYDLQIKSYGRKVIYDLGKKMTSDDWADSKKIGEMEKEAVKELRKIVTDDWGLKIHEIMIVDDSSHRIHRISHEGNPFAYPHEEGMAK